MTKMHGSPPEGSESGSLPEVLVHVVLFKALNLHVHFGEIHVVYQLIA